MKDHEIAQVVNAIRDAALEFRDAQQLRERIARLVVPLLKVEAYRCKFCGNPTSTDPADQEPPSDYCGDHT